MVRHTVLRFTLLRKPLVRALLRVSHTLSFPLMGVLISLLRRGSLRTAEPFFVKATDRPAPEVERC